MSWGCGRNSYSDLWCLNEGVGGAFIFPYVQQQQNVLKYLVTNVDAEEEERKHDSIAEMVFSTEILSLAAG